MIDSVHGQITRLTGTYVVLLVGGVGLRINVPTTVLDVVDGVGHSVMLHTYLLVRETELTLYGFADIQERDLFEVLIGVSGVGPRIALAMISTLTVEHMQNAIAREEPEILTRVPGIGKKLAQKLLFELKDKLAIEPSLGLAAISDIDTDVIATLTALGYSIVEAQTALQAIPKDAPQDIEERVRLALGYFG